MPICLFLTTVAGAALSPERFGSKRALVAGFLTRKPRYLSRSLREYRRKGLYKDRHAGHTSLLPSAMLKS